MTTLAPVESVLATMTRSVKTINGIPDAAAAELALGAAAKVGLPIPAAGDAIEASRGVIAEYVARTGNKSVPFAIKNVANGQRELIPLASSIEPMFPGVNPSGLKVEAEGRVFPAVSYVKENWTRTDKSIEAIVGFSNLGETSELAAIRFGGLHGNTASAHVV